MITAHLVLILLTLLVATESDQDTDRAPHDGNDG
jgi:hypothetical protein